MLLTYTLYYFLTPTTYYMKGIIMSKSSIVLHVDYVEEVTVFLLDIFLILKLLKMLLSLYNLLLLVIK